MPFVFGAPGKGARVNKSICQDKHTTAPAGYLQWQSWAAEMAKTHRQTQCPDCGLWAVWIPKKEAPHDPT